MKTLRYWLKKVAKFSDRLLSPDNLVLAERITLVVSGLSLMIHLGAVFLASNGVLPESLGVEPNNYLKPIATPFAFILIFEVFLLVVSVRNSIVGYLGKQLQVISLIVIRDAFKIFGDIGDLNLVIQDTALLADLTLKIIVGVAVFGLSIVFYFFRIKLRELGETGHEGHYPLLSDFKKGLSLLLVSAAGLITLLFLVNSNYDTINLLEFSGFDLDSLFSTIFVMMIYADVLILLFFSAYENAYQLVFRNISFVVASILIRFSITAGGVYEKIFLMGGVLFGLLVLLLYYWDRKLKVDMEQFVED